MSRYIIIGAGAVGGGIAGLLADAGVETVAVARGEHARTVADRGLTIRMPDRSFAIRLPCVTDPRELDLTPADVLVLCTKTQQAEAALSRWADVPVRGGGTAGDTLPILTALNGVTAESMALRWFARVIGVCVWMPAVHLEPGEVIVRGTPTRGTFHLGPYPADEPADDPADGRVSGGREQAVLDAVERDWTAAGFRISRPDDVMAWKYRKLISNIGNAFEALVGDRGPIDALVERAQVEARAVLAAAKITVTDDATEAAARADSFDVAPVPGEPAHLGGSSWQSLRRGTGSIETDYLNGEIARLAHLHRVPAPINTAVARSARLAAAADRRPGEISAVELAIELGLSPG